jgi:predicted molibdopterin-dependent oxidoreductase YjgC
MGSKLASIADEIRAGKIKTLVVLGEDVTKQGIGEDLLAKLELLIVSDILPNKTTAKAHFILPGCAHVEKRGSFTNAKGRVQRFFQAIDAKGSARAEWDFFYELIALMGLPACVGTPSANIETLFNQMAQETPAFAGLNWAALGDLGADAHL